MFFPRIILSTARKTDGNAEVWCYLVLHKAIIPFHHWLLLPVATIYTGCREVWKCQLSSRRSRIAARNRMLAAHCPLMVFWNEREKSPSVRLFDLYICAMLIVKSSGGWFCIFAFGVCWLGLGQQKHRRLMRKEEFVRPKALAQGARIWTILLSAVV